MPLHQSDPSLSPRPKHVLGPHDWHIVAHIHTHHVVSLLQSYTLPSILPSPLPPTTFLPSPSITPTLVRLVPIHLPSSPPPVQLALLPSMVFSRRPSAPIATVLPARPPPHRNMSAASTSVPAARPNPPSPASSRKAAKASASSSAASSRPSQRAADPYYGHEETSVLCARFITALFQCPNIPPAAQPGGPTPTLAHFVAYALHRTRLPSVVTFAALLLLQRLKTRFPAARGSSGHRLFISAFMIASKVICDDTYSNQSWCIVGQKMFALKEINQMEREMCGYLEWNLNVAGDELAEFEARTRAEHGPRAVARASSAVSSEVSLAASSPAETLANVYPSPETTPDPSSSSSRPIRPVPALHKRAPTTFPSPASMRNAYLTPSSNVSPQPPALASASSSLASSPASEDCKTPSPIASVNKPKRPISSRTLSGKTVADIEQRFGPLSQPPCGVPLSVGGW
ncbi:PHO85 cyclin-2 [Vanrija pseudolonga]|uniref:PHO85 cyclin-2 n=1 Tax=Vanrija pseudolonga TaxID=143232 RepID=A0AAF0YK98_9TREE|nr:PHO85 cyclin-2 [Vanrija pseudolonga]